MNFGHHKQPFSAFNANNLANVCGAYAYLCRPWHVPSRRSNLASRAECTSCCSRRQVIRQKNSLHWRATRYNRTDGLYGFRGIYGEFNFQRVWAAFDGRDSGIRRAKMLRRIFTHARQVQMVVLVLGIGEATHFTCQRIEKPWTNRLYGAFETIKCSQPVNIIRWFDVFWSTFEFNLIQFKSKKKKKMQMDFPLSMMDNSALLRWKKWH